MALSFLSNKKASQIISDGSGYKGPMDYLFNMDVPNDDYFVLSEGNRIPMELGYLVSSSRTTNAGRSLNEEMAVSIVPADVPRRTYLPSAKTYGVLAEEIRYNFFDQKEPIASRTTTMLPVTTNFFACFAIGGTAKVSATEVDIIKGTGSYEDPMFFKLKEGGTQTPMVTVSPGGYAVQVEQLIGKRSASVVPSRTGLAKSPEEITLLETALGGDMGSAVFRIIENDRRVEHTASEYIPYVQFMQDESNYVAMNRRHDNNTLTLRLFKDGSEVSVSQIALVTGTNTIAVSWHRGVVSFAVNGVAYDVPATMSPTFKPAKVSFLSKIGTWVTVPGNGALSNLIGYDRALTLEELARATTSWN